MAANPSDGAKPPKEMRTFRRDGDVITEDYEKMNPDGTVTKTITMINEKTGEKDVSVYKMDKSGIVRKLDTMDQKTEDLLQQLRKQIAVTKEKVDALKERQGKENTKSLLYENGEYENGETYTRRVEDEIPDKHEMAYNFRNINKPIELTPKQQAMVQQHKENIMNYGTQKLIKQLNKKLNDDKFNASYPLTDEQKDSVIEYGVRKLHKLMEKNLDEERLIYDVMSNCPDFGKVDLSGRGTKEIPANQSVPFNINPHKEIASEEVAKPVSFSMRPEKPRKPLSDTEKSGDRKVVHNIYKNLWDRVMNPDAILESVTGKQNANETSKDKDEKYDSTNEKDETDPEDENQSVPNSYKQIKDSVKKLIADDELYKKSPLMPEQKEGIIDYALQQVRSVFKDSMDKDKSSRKKKINLLEYFDEDEIYDYGKRALKKLVRRSLKGFDLDQEVLKLDKVDDPEVAERRDAFYQYLGDIVEGKVKESDPLPVPIQNQKPKQEEDPKEEPKWDYNSILSSIFGEKDKNNNNKPEENSKEKKKISDFDSFFSWLMPDKNKTDTDKPSNEPTENVPKIKPRFYQLEPKASSQNEQGKPEIDNNRFDLKSLLKKIQEAAVKKFSESRQDENFETPSKDSYQDHTQTSIKNKLNSQERALKGSEVDASLSKIRQINDEDSNSRSNRNKPPYLKERISGLSSIPRPKITTASHFERNQDYSDQISFQLKPHNYDDTEKEGDKSRSFENQRIEAGKPCSHEQDFQPWWFESPDSFVKKTFTEKPSLKGGFMDAPMMNSSFSTGGNGFSTKGSFSSGNMLE